jgi:alpha-N-acetylglucosaminidase
VLVVVIVAVCLAELAHAAEFSAERLLSKVPLDRQLRAAEALARRLLPTAARKIYFAALELDGWSAHDEFELANVASGGVSIRCNSGVACASGFYWYLKHSCNASISWGEEGSGDHVKFLDALATLPPVLDAPVRIQASVPLRYYMNVCTSSYSMAFWQWERWEREIDWMAMNGINLPLSFTGAEYVHRELFLEFGVERAALDEFFSGPAFLAWHRMGNLRAWAGPLSDEWIDGQAELQRKILARQRELGMISVLPGFAGFVPHQLKERYPDAHIEPSSQWWNTANASLCCNRLIRPEDPLWKTLGVRFYQLMVEKFGTDHVYNCDMFNEMSPTSSDEDYLRDSAAAVIDAMRQADDDAVWLMQGWLFYAHQNFWRPAAVRAYLSGVSNDRMIILDLVSEDYPLWSRFESFYGKPFIWCLLHNFGAVRGMYGNLTHLSIAPLRTLEHPDSTMVGMGLSMEAIEHNPVVYELMNEMAWRDESPDVPQWLRGYVVRRYGVDDAELQEAWRLLHRSVYATNVFAKSYMEAEPMVEMQRRTIGWFWMHSEPRQLAIDTTLLVAAWRLFASAAKRGVARGNGPFEYDLVDVSRQAMANLFFDAHVLFEWHFHQHFKAHNSNGTASVDALTDAMLEMILETDELLGANVNFLLGRWVAAARSWSDDEQQQQLLQFNAMNLITLWGPEGEIKCVGRRPVVTSLTLTLTHTVSSLAQ